MESRHIRPVLKTPIPWYHPQIRNKIVVMGKYDLFILTFYYSRNIYNRDQIDADRRDHNSDL